MKKANGTIISEKSKRLLSVNIMPSGTMSLIPYDRITTVWIDDNGTEHTNTHKEKLASIPMKTVVKPNKDSYTDTFNAVLDEYGPKMAYVATRTVYNHSGDKKVYKLLCECIEYGKRGQTARQFEESVAQYLSKYNPIALEEVKEEVKFRKQTVRYTVSSRKIANADMFDFTGTMNMEKVKISSFKMVKGTDGKLHKVERIPTARLEKTAFGKMMNDSKIAHGTDAEDLIQEAKKALVELANIGLIRKPSDIWTYADYVYHTVNNLIHSNQRHGKNDSIETQTDEKGDKAVVMTIKAIDKMLENVERTATVKKIRKTLSDTISKRENKTNILYTFDHVFILGKDQRTVADELGVAQTQVQRYCNSIYSHLHTKEVYETLRACIWG